MRKAFKSVSISMSLMMAMSLSSCTLVEKSVNKLWGQQERPVVDKAPYVQKRRPAANPQGGGFSSPVVMPGMGSMTPAGDVPPYGAMSTDFQDQMPPFLPQAQGGVPNVPPYPIQGGLSPEVNMMPSMPVNTLPGGGELSKDFDKMGEGMTGRGSPMDEMSKGYNKAKGNIFSGVNPYAKYKVSSQFEPMAAAWLVKDTGEVLQDIPVYDDSNAVKESREAVRHYRKNKASVDRSQSMFPFPEYSPQAGQVEVLNDNSKAESVPASEPKATAPMNTEKEDIKKSQDQSQFENKELRVEEVKVSQEILVPQGQTYEVVNGAALPEEDEQENTAPPVVDIPETPAYADAPQVLVMEPQENAPSVTDYAVPMDETAPPVIDTVPTEGASQMPQSEPIGSFDRYTGTLPASRYRR